jgi:LCP family protein required for cell wall assembly
MRKVFNLSNLLALTVSLVVFVAVLTVWNTNLGVAVAAVVGGASGAVAWFVASRSRQGPSLAGTLDGIPCLGSIPPIGSTPAPTLVEDETSDRFTGILREIEGHTTGRVLLVSSPSPGMGASSVALNLAISASKAGRRVMLVDADPSAHGIGRFLSSGTSPGLSDVAMGTATLTTATRMWTLDDGSSFPMLPAGDHPADPADLAGILVADALDVVSEHADLIVIDVPPVMWSSATPELGAHADGTILVLTDGADPATVETAVDQLAAAGAPVVGYVRNRSTATAPLTPRPAKHAAVLGAVLAGLLLVGYTGYTGAQLINSWRQVETQALDTGAVGAIGGSRTPASQDDPDDVGTLEEGDEAPDSTPSVTAPTEAYETLLVIGSDEIAGAADVILYLVRPTNGSDPFMVSLPRDLYVENPCTGGNSRINSLIKGCPADDINGPTLLSSQVETITGIEVDHFAWFDFAGFENVVDAVGGVEICLDYPVRDAKAELDLPAGCTDATGAQALSWVRSRKTQQLVGGSWRSVPGASDFQRNEHQQDVIIQLFSQLKAFDSPKQLTTKAASLAENFVLDDGFSITEAVNLAWGLRSIDIDSIKRLELPVRLTRSTKGQSIVVLTAPFDEVLRDAYGSLLPSEDGGSTAAPSR